VRIQLEFLTKWYFFVPTLLALISLIWSVVNSVVGKAITHKITQNDLKHLTADVKNLKEDEKEFKTEIKQNVHKIFLSIRRIEKKQGIRDAICNERHQIDKK